MLSTDDIKKLKAVFATKEELKNLSKELKNAIENQNKTFATKQDLKDEIANLRSVFSTKHELKIETARLEIKLYEVKKELQEDMSQLRNDVLDKLDAVFGELKDFRQEQMFHFQKHVDIDERLDCLEAARIAN